MTDKIPDVFMLSDGDKISALWLKLAEHLRTELHNARGKLEDEKLTDIQTAIIRGRIKTLKNILSLGLVSPSTPLDG
jgi:hypothetical protein